MPDRPRAPKQSLDAERAVLAAMLTDPGAIPRAAACLKPTAFYRRAHAKMFESATAMHARGEPVDVVTLAAELESRGELAQCGGPVALATILESATSSANLEHHARMVRRAYATRERVRIGEALANGIATDPTACRDLLRTLEALETEAEAATDPAEAWAALAMSGAQLISADLPALPSWLGDGLLPAGELAFLTGHSGVGKTFLTVQLMSALSIGHTFCGITTAPARVGLVELEMPWASVQKRVASLHSGDFERMAFLCSPPGAVHVNEAITRANIVAFVRRHNLDVLIFDPFNRLHDLDENSGSDMGHVLEGLHEIRRLTGVAILVLHHVRKTPSGLPAGPHSRASALDAGRGSSRLTNDPATVMALDETKGFVRLTFGKVRHGITPPTIYLKRNERGFFDVSDDPSLAPMRRADALRAMLERAGDEGITSELAAEVLKVTVRTVRRDLENIGAKLVTEGRHGRRWIMPIESLPPEEQTLDL